MDILLGLKAIVDAGFDFLMYRVDDDPSLPPHYRLRARKRCDDQRVWQVTHTIRDWDRIEFELPHAIAEIAREVAPYKLLDPPDVWLINALLTRKQIDPDAPEYIGFPKGGPG